jgi:hypothetical protein
MAPVVVVLLTGFWLACQALLVYVGLGLAMDIGFGDSPTPARLLDRWKLLVTSFGVLLVAAPAAIAGSARLLGLRRTSIVYAIVAAILVPFAAWVVIGGWNEYS